MLHNDHIQCQIYKNGVTTVPYLSKTSTPPHTEHIKLGQIYLRFVTLLHLPHVVICLLYGGKTVGSFSLAAQPLFLCMLWLPGKTFLTCTLLDPDQNHSVPCLILVSLQNLSLKFPFHQWFTAVVCFLKQCLIKPQLREELCLEPSVNFCLCLKAK